MKNVVKSIAAVFVLALCLGLLAGCADSSTSLVGIWKLTSGEALGINVPIESLGEYAKYTYTLNEDGTVTAFAEKVGTWTHNGSSLTIIEDGITMNCKYNGSSFVFVLGDVKMTFSRTNSPYPY
ncbi:MAG: hypothetical protein ACI4JZ_07375 [Oscillospiraceae bacterium]